MKALVLGGCGFIGSHLVDRLLAREHRVRVLDRTYERFRKPLQGVDYRIADFDNVPVLAEALEGIDVVYHLISSTVPATSNLDPIADIQGNLIGTLRLLQLLVNKQVPKVVFLSSGGTVYGIPQQVPILETHSLNPICSYGVVKVAIENYLQMFHHLYGLQYTILRGANPYGERQGHTGVQGVISTFMNQLLSGEQIEIWGNGEIIRDFIYVGDLVDLCVEAGQSNVCDIFNGGSGKGYSINEVLNNLSEITNQKIEPHYRNSRVFDVNKIVLDIHKANTTFNWKPKVDIYFGMKRSWEWMITNKDKLNR